MSFKKDSAFASTASFLKIISSQFYLFSPVRIVSLDPIWLRSKVLTYETKVQNIGYIAKLDTNRTQILNVYLDRKTAAKLNGYQSSSALDNPVKNEKIANGFFYMLYDNCDEKLQEDFEENNGEILLYKEGVGQYDNKNILIKEFACKYDCIKQLKMSDKTLRKALDQKVMYNNYYFKYIGSKLFI